MTLRTSTRRVLAALVVLLVSTLPAAAPAHEAGLSHATLRQGAAGLQLSLRFDAADFRRLERAGLSDAGARLDAGGDALLPLAPARVRRDGDHVRVVLTYPQPDAERLRFSFAGFGALRHGHRQYVELTGLFGRRLADAVLQESAPTAWLER